MAAIQLLFLDVSTTKTSVGDPILKLKLSEQKSVYDQILHKLTSEVTEGCAHESFAGHINFLPTEEVFG